LVSRSGEAGTSNHWVHLNLLSLIFGKISNHKEHISEEVDNFIGFTCTQWLYTSSATDFSENKRENIKLRLGLSLAVG
jgi:hypothetical protein